MPFFSSFRKDASFKCVIQSLWGRCSGERHFIWKNYIIQNWLAKSKTYSGNPSHFLKRKLMFWCYLTCSLFKKKKVKLLSHVWLFSTPWTVAYQAPPSTGFSRQDHWSGVPSPSPGGLPNPGIDPGSPALQADALPSEPPGNHRNYINPERENKL